MREVLDIIYTPENGEQVQLTLPLSELPNIFQSKAAYESRLILFWLILNSSRPVTKTQPVLPKLVKISTCIYSENPVPKWYGDWDGKFYYEHD